MPPTVNIFIPSDGVRYIIVAQKRYIYAYDAIPIDNDLFLWYNVENERDFTERRYT